MQTNVKTSWHLNKNVPVGIIVTILFQAAGGLWFLSKLDSRIDVLEKQDIENSQVNNAFYGLSESMKSMQSSLVRIEANQSKTNDRLNYYIEKDK